MNSDHIHVIPQLDLREHDPQCTCWCNPTRDEEEPRVWVHHAMDQREKYETGEIRPQ